MEFCMNFNATLLGQAIFIFALIMLVLSYILGKRKTETPKTTAFIGFLTALVPPLAIVFLIVLILKNDVALAKSDIGQ